MKEGDSRKNGGNQKLHCRFAPVVSFGNLPVVAYAGWLAPRAGTLSSVHSARLFPRAGLLLSGESVEDME